MQNLQRWHIIEDRGGKVQYHVYGHGSFRETDLPRIITKQSLWESAGTIPVDNTIYRVVMIIAADGWEDAD